MHFMSSHSLRRESSSIHVDHPHCLPWRRLMGRQPTSPEVSGLSFEGRRQARLRDAFAKISQEPAEHPTAEHPTAEHLTAEHLTTERGAGDLEQQAPESADLREPARHLSFEAWMAGASIRPPPSLGPPQSLGRPVR